MNNQLATQVPKSRPKAKAAPGSECDKDISNSAMQNTGPYAPTHFGKELCHALPHLVQMLQARLTVAIHGGKRTNNYGC